MNIPRLRLAQLPTPLTLLKEISSELAGPNIWLKRDDLTESAAGGNKLRKLEFSIAEAQRQHANVLITSGGIQSNHCRATAIMAAKLGMKCHLILRGRPTTESDGNLLLDQLAGANITYANADQWQALPGLYETVMQDYSSQGDKAYSIPIGASDEIGLWGYIECARELKTDFQRLKISPEYIVMATGSGGTQGGLIIGQHLHQLPGQVVGINVAEQPGVLDAKIKADIDKWQSRYQKTLPDLPINVINGYLEPGYGRADTNVYQTIQLMAQKEGIFLDPVYTGKAFDALIQEINKGPMKDATNIVFLHSGGIFGLFPHRAQLQELATL